jgi:hypothetical protein
MLQVISKICKRIGVCIYFVNNDVELEIVRFLLHVRYVYMCVAKF